MVVANYEQDSAMDYYKKLIKEIWAYAFLVSDSEPLKRNTWYDHFKSSTNIFIEDPTVGNVIVKLCQSYKLSRNHNLDMWPIVGKLTDWVLVSNAENNAIIRHFYVTCAVYNLISLLEANKETVMENLKNKKYTDSIDMLFYTRMYLSNMYENRLRIDRYVNSIQPHYM